MLVSGRAPGRLRMLLPLLAGVFVVTLTVSLGNWQLRRAQEKTALQSLLDDAKARPAARATTTAPLAAGTDGAGLRPGQRLLLEGEWLPAATILLDNRTHAGQAGYHVLTPLKLADGSGVVVVNRGWIAVGPDRRAVPDVSVARGPVRLEGRLHRPEASPFTLARANQSRGDKVVQVLDLAQWAAASGLGLARCPVTAAADGVGSAMTEGAATEGASATALPAQGAAAASPCVAPWIVLQTTVVNDGLVRDWPLPSAGIERHRGYAFQWYALAALAAVLTLAYVWHLVSRRDHEQRNPRFAGH